MLSVLIVSKGVLQYKTAAWPDWSVFAFLELFPAVSFPLFEYTLILDR